jgi:hypothetical protein
MIHPTTLEGGEKIICHRPEVCEGEICCVHNPSAHHMRDWPQHWRDDTHVMERLCPHGVGHPDPDGLAFLLKTPGFETEGIHGCDGCCLRKS